MYLGISALDARQQDVQPWGRLGHPCFGRARAKTRYAVNPSSIAQANKLAVVVFSSTTSPKPIRSAIRCHFHPSFRLHPTRSLLPACETSRDSYSLNNPVSQSGSFVVGTRNIIGSSTSFSLSLSSSSSQRTVQIPRIVQIPTTTTTRKKEEKASTSTKTSPRHHAAHDPLARRRRPLHLGLGLLSIGPRARGSTHQNHKAAARPIHPPPLRRDGHLRRQRPRAGAATQGEGGEPGHHHDRHESQQ